MTVEKDVDDEVTATHKAPASPLPSVTLPYKKWRTAGSIASAPPCFTGKNNMERIEPSQRAPLTAPLACLATPAKLFGGDTPRPSNVSSQASSSNTLLGSSGDASSKTSSSEPEASQIVPNASVLSFCRLENAGAIRRRQAGSTAMAFTSSSRSSKSLHPSRKVISRIPDSMRGPEGRPLNALPEVIFTQRYANPIPIPFNINLRRSDGGQNSSESTAHSADNSQDTFNMETPRVGMQLTKGKFGSLRRLGNKLRKSVSLRHRSASLSIDGQQSPRVSTNLGGTPLRPVATRSRSRSLSSSLPTALGLEIGNEGLAWEYSLP
ncbi:uncharacterized protein C8Q71DRAFT_792988 [Rhodofomes roseus]|uniref:Uncharacterized protein n=1 Tax=Rhodofomes roseus TaxID=34475 RepID=A0ABQ8JX88_9APHY|nr:uncharacterized protein C8Q71DRAFT_792988 [Rhodofomes roseus]KAH9828687.1 hypothetical protein C8Q71DRAFT_792988 [Rhodofomes roseus]